MRATDPLPVMGTRLDLISAAAQRRVRRTMGRRRGWAGTIEELAASFLDAQLESIDAALEYLASLVLGPVAVNPAPFLGQLGTQALQEFLDVTPDAVNARVAGGMDPDEALERSTKMLVDTVAIEPHIVGRDVVATIANNDPRFVGYARVANPGACDWCKMLAGRGAVYTENTATKTRDGQPYHKPQPRLRKDGSTYMAGGMCQCTMMALPKGAKMEPAPDDVPRAKKTSVAQAYRKGANTPQRAASVARQLEILRAQSAAGQATDWTSAKIAELEAEQTRFVLGGPRSAALRVLVRRIGMRYDPNQPRDPKGTPTGGQWTDGPPRNAYEGTHDAPDREYGAPMHDPDMMMPDLVAHPEWYSIGDPDVERESIAAVKKAAAEGPTAKIKVYRAVPDDVPDAAINPGDWVTPSVTYAKQHGMGALNGEFKILELEVLAGDLFTEGNSIAEWGWDPPRRKRRSASLRYDPNQPRDPKGTPTGGQWVAASGGGLPAGWTFDERALLDVGVAQAQHRTVGGGTITVTAASRTFFGEARGLRPTYTDAQLDQVRQATLRVARLIDDLYSKNPTEDDLEVKITGTALPRDRGGETSWSSSITQIRINANLFTDQAKADEWAEAILSRSNAGDPSDILRTVVSHEYGHVFAKYAGVQMADVMGVEMAPWDAAREYSINSTLDVVNSREEFDMLTGYAKSSMVEAYAELFTEWSLRDRVTPTAMALEMAEAEGWT